MSQISAELFPSLKSKQLVDLVVHEVIRMITENKLQPGTKLPPEIKLAERLCVSRTVVREAVRGLIAKGLVETRHGVGTIVREIGGDQLSDHFSMMLHMNEVTLENLHQVRSILEVETAGIAAAQATSTELKKLERLVEDLEKGATSDPVAYVESDAAFHRHLAAMSHNPMLVMLLDSIGGTLKQVRLSVAKHPGISREGVPDHRKIMQRVRARDISGAQRAMRRHLKRAREIQKQAGISGNSK
jgi:GntR family transcriptional repressor for pyruvate dehydrogenase complex